MQYGSEEIWPQSESSESSIVIVNFSICATLLLSS